MKTESVYCVIHDPSLSVTSAQILDARSQCRRSYVLWHLIFLGSLHWSCFITPFWCLEFWGGGHIFLKIYAFLLKLVYIYFSL